MLIIIFFCVVFGWYCSENVVVLRMIFCGGEFGVVYVWEWLCWWWCCWRGEVWRCWFVLGELWFFVWIDFEVFVSVVCSGDLVGLCLFKKGLGFGFGRLVVLVWWGREVVECVLLFCFYFFEVLWCLVGKLLGGKFCRFRVFGVCGVVVFLLEWRLLICCFWSYSDCLKGFWLGICKGFVCCIKCWDLVCMRCIDECGVFWYFIVWW